jgi:hypothetical protein
MNGSVSNRGDVATQLLGVPVADEDLGFEGVLPGRARLGASG